MANDLLSGKRASAAEWGLDHYSLLQSAYQSALARDTEFLIVVRAHISDRPDGIFIHTCLPAFFVCDKGHPAVLSAAWPFVCCNTASVYKFIVNDSGRFFKILILDAHDHIDLIGSLVEHADIDA